jgi:hypothetical protein
MAIGYFTDVAEADDYFIDERLETEAWDDLIESSPTFQKTKVLTNAFNRIFHLKDYSLPDPALPPSAAQLVKLKMAQAEMAYYLAVHLGDEDRRKGLQAQAVIEAVRVKEKYDEAKIYDVAVPAFVKELLDEWKITGTEFGAVDICRDENESVGTKVCDLD